MRTSRVMVSPTSAVGRSRRVVTVAPCSVSAMKKRNAMCNADCRSPKRSRAVPWRSVKFGVILPILQDAVAAFGFAHGPVDQRAFFGFLCVQHLLGLLGRHLRELRRASFLLRFALLV